MASRPAKRQRRSTIVLSDNDESDYAPTGLPLRSSSKENDKISANPFGKPARLPEKPATPSKKTSRTTKASIAAKDSPKSSPEKYRNSRKNNTGEEKSKSLYTFFNKATEEQRWARRDTPTAASGGDDFGDDDIVDGDDNFEEAKLELVNCKKHSQDELDRRKRASQTAFEEPPISSQRFVKPPIPAKKITRSTSIVSTVSEDKPLHPWAERYSPTNLEELAVHKKKVADVQQWLSSAFSGREKQRLLVLKGPAGCGKTTTLSLLCESLGCEMIWWTNPTVSESGVTSSIASQFGDFLNRSGKFDSLSFGSSTDVLKSSTMSRDKLLVVEEYPTTLTRYSSALDAFRSVIIQYLAASGASQAQLFSNAQTTNTSRPPLVMIISETLLSSNTAATDSFTAHRLLGPEISNHPLVTVMEFNPVAITFMVKALELVVKKEARDSKRRRTPGPAVLHRLAEMGDIRSAVNSLEFLCLRDDESGGWSGTVASKSNRGSKDGVPMSEREKQSLELISQRETTLDMFHAAGKVVHNKREDPRISDIEAEPPPKPPDHLAHCNKPKVSLVDIEVLLNETGTDIQTFISTVHENYILSCTGDSFVDFFDGCADSLSTSDVLSPDGRPTARSTRGTNITNPVQTNVATDSLRQDEISFQVATRGILFSLPYPVSRGMHPNGRKGDSFKMFYPASLRLWKPTEEIESLIDMYMNPYGSLAITSASRSRDQGVASWAARSSAYNARPFDSDDTTLDTVRVLADKAEMTLERLPYLTRILRSRKADYKTAAKITTLSGLNVAASAAEEEPFDEDDAGHISAATADAAGGQPAPPISPLKLLTKKSSIDLPHRSGIKQEPDHGSGPAGGLEKLYISDDDIQDD